MRKFNVNVNGTSYEVHVEEIGGQPAGDTPAAASATPHGQEIVAAPMPGSVLDVRVRPGDTVAAGQAVLVLEAMKMENEILTPRDGTVISVNVTKGAAVNSGDTLLIIG